MKIHILLPFILTLAAAQADVTFSFDNQTTFDSQFPVANRELQNASTATLETSPTRLQLTGESDTSAGSIAMIYSNDSLSNDLDFISSEKTFYFDAPSMTFPDTGATYYTALGLADSPNGRIDTSSGPNNAFYFLINRQSTAPYSRTLLFVEKRNPDGIGSADFTIHYNLDITDAFTTTSVSFEYLSFTVDATSWSVSGLTIPAPGNDAQNIAGSGDFTATWDGDWGDQNNLGLMARQTSNSDTRYTILDLQSATVSVPESSEYALLLGSLGLVLVGLRRRKP